MEEFAFTLEVEARYASESFITMYETTGCYIPQRIVVLLD
jgi:hypothetical protein